MKNTRSLLMVQPTLLTTILTNRIVRILYLLAIGLLINTYVQAQPTMGWEQLGSNIEGNEVHDQFGATISCSHDGSVVAVGAPAFLFANRPGYVKVYEIDDNGTWTQRGQTLVGDFADERFGQTVSISNSGMTVAVGASEFDLNGAGKIKVFRYFESVSSWGKIGDDIIGHDPGNLLGQHMELAGGGNRLVVGEPNDDNGEGRVRVFDYDSGSDEWDQVGGAYSGTAVGVRYGSRIAISNDGNTWASASQNIHLEPNLHRISVRRWINGSWEKISQSGGVRGPDTSLPIQSVALSQSGFLLLVSYGFYARVYYYDQTEEAYLVTGDDLVIPHGNKFISHADISDNGDHITLGTPSGSVNGLRTGQVAVYTRQSGGNTYALETYPINGTVTEGRMDVAAISQDGTRIFTGAPYDASNVNAGEIRAFTRVERIPNDTPCEAALLIPNGELQTGFSTTNGSTEPNENELIPHNSSGASAFFQNAWFFFEAPTSGSVVIETCDESAFDTELGLYSTDDCNDLSGFELIKWNDDFCNSRSKIIQDGLTPGQIYYVMVDGYSSNSGNYSIRLSDGMPSSVQNLATLGASVIISPNPTAGNFQLKLTAPQVLKEVVAMLVDANGRLVREQYYGDVRGEINDTFFANDLPAGIYQLRISSHEGTTVERVVLQ